jgi:hypothetical protein
MKSTRYLIAFLAAFILNSCCTKKKCYCDTASIRLQYNFKRYRYSEDLQQFFLLRVDKGTYKVIDSTSVGVSFVSGSVQYNHQSWITLQTYTDQTTLRDYSYLLVNRGLNFADTITNIQYRERETSFECNGCFLIKDIETCTTLDSLKFDYNQRTVQQNELPFTVVVE